jgi:hypothetical protein
MAKHSWYLGLTFLAAQQIAAGCVTRERFFTGLTLDPPDARPEQPRCGSGSVGDCRRP